MPKSKKLIKLLRRRRRAEPRTILAGIAEAYQPEQLVGKTHRHRRQPEAGQADGHRVERHGAGRQPGGRQPPILVAVDEQPAAGHPRRLSQHGLQHLAVLIDSHCHIAGPEFAGDLEAVVARARAAGAARRARRSSPPTTSRSCGRPAAVGAHWPEVRFSIGVHPHAAGKFAARPAGAAARRGRGHRGAAAGARGRRDRPRLPLRLRAARRAAAPCSASRSRWRARRAAADRHPHPRGRGRHASRSWPRSGPATSAASSTASPATAAMARRALDAGFHLSLAGIVTFPRAVELKEVAAFVPARSAADRNRQPVPGAGAAPRQTQRAGARVARVRGTVAELRGDTTADDGRGADVRQLPPPLQPVTPRPRHGLAWLAALTLRARIWSDLTGVNPTAQKPSARHSRADVRADSRRPPRGRARVRAARPVAGRAHPDDRQLHPGRRRQAHPPGGAADGGAHVRLHGRARRCCTRRWWSSSTPRRSSTTTSSTSRSCAAAATPCTPSGATTSRCCSATSSTSSRCRWR